jgi:hypothetical protein
MHGFVADTEAEAVALFWPRYLDVMSRIGRERGWPPPSRARFDAERGSDGALLVGSAEQVADKLAALQALFGHTRTLVQLSVGTVPHAHMRRAIELLGATWRRPCASRRPGGRLPDAAARAGISSAVVACSHRPVAMSVPRRRALRGVRVAVLAGLVAQAGCAASASRPRPCPAPQRPPRRRPARRPPPRPPAPA